VSRRRDYEQCVADAADTVVLPLRTDIAGKQRRVADSYTRPCIIIGQDRADFGAAEIHAHVHTALRWGKPHAAPNEARGFQATRKGPGRAAPPLGYGAAGRYRSWGRDRQFETAGTSSVSG
jgi:hypothetical protein